MQHAFIRVPETHLPCGIVVPPFEASQFLCSQAPDSRVPRAASGASYTPWVRISYLTALAACRAAGWSLITEQQWLAIAHDVASQNANWTGGAFGEGKLFQGLRKRSVLAPDPRSSGMGVFPRAGAHRMVWDDRGLIRGGGCRSGKDAGAFALYAALLHGEYPEAAK